MNPDILRQLEKSLGYTFKNQQYLIQALKHRSKDNEHNERLEFLGDGLLNFSIAKVIYEQLPYAAEGELTTLRAHLVREETLAKIAKSLNLDRYVILGNGEIKSGGALRPSTLADALEAVFAAILMDSNFYEANEVILRLYDDAIVEAAKMKPEALKQDFKDAKSRLQEYLQSKKKALPEYKLVSSTGKDHEQIFEIACIVGRLQTVAKGTSRKRAEREAATQMLEKLQ